MRIEADFIAYVDGLPREQATKPQQALMISNWTALAAKEVAKDNSVAAHT